MKTNSIFKRSIMTLMAFTMLFTAMFGFSTTKASAARTTLDRVISDEYATAYINTDGSGYMTLNKVYTQDNPLTEIAGVPLKDIIRFDDKTGYVGEIFTYDRTDFRLYDHAIHVVGSGPEKLAWTGHLIFTDESGDYYTLTLWVNAYRHHNVNYDSDQPMIKTIRWYTSK